MHIRTKLVLLSLSASVTAGCDRPFETSPSRSTPIATTRSRASEDFPSPKDAAEAARNSLTPKDRQEAARTHLQRLGKEAVPAVVSALPEPGDQGWSEEALWLAGFIAEFAPANSPEFESTRLKAESAATKFLAWQDRKLRLMAIAGMSLSTRDSVEIGFRKERHEKLVQRLKEAVAKP